MLGAVGQGRENPRNIRPAWGSNMASEAASIAARNWPAEKSSRQAVAIHVWCQQARQGLPQLRGTAKPKPAMAQTMVWWFNEVPLTLVSRVTFLSFVVDARPPSLHGEASDTDLNNFFFQRTSFPSPGRSISAYYR